MKEKNDFHILYTFNSVKVLKSIFDESNNIITLTNIKKSLLDMFKEKNNINDVMKNVKKIEAVIKVQLLLPILNNDIIEIIEYGKQFIIFCKFCKDELKYIIEKENIKIEEIIFIIITI